MHLHDYRYLFVSVVESGKGLCLGPRTPTFALARLSGRVMQHSCRFSYTKQALAHTATRLPVCEYRAAEDIPYREISSLTVASFLVTLFFAERPFETPTDHKVLSLSS